MEMDKVPAAGYKIVGLPVSGFDRAHLMNNVKVMARLAKSLRLARKTIREFKPDIAVMPVDRLYGWRLRKVFLR
jgi:UDP-N-acetylglucosamine--N-acetylmuramyl-(pentapeptide) pyrophosphoryl-undecaprenol N-acetylglucosamine transferase